MLSVRSPSECTGSMGPICHYGTATRLDIGWRFGELNFYATEPLDPNSNLLLDDSIARELAINGLQIWWLKGDELGWELYYYPEF